MNMSKNTYKAYAEGKAKRSPVFTNCLKAFAVGGLICAIGEGLSLLYVWLGQAEENIRTLVPATLILAATLLTGIGVFDKLAHHAGAGTLVPITGFANAVVAPAIDTKAEGLVLGVGAKIFTVAGPVILYGTLASAIYGVIYFIIERM